MIKLIKTSPFSVKLAMAFLFLVYITAFIIMPSAMVIFTGILGFVISLVRLISYFADGV